MNLQMWQWESAGAGNKNGLLNNIATEWYKLLMQEKNDCAIVAICKRWDSQKRLQRWQ